LPSKTGKREKVSQEFTTQLFFAGGALRAKIIVSPPGGAKRKSSPSGETLHKTLDFLKNGHKLSQINKSDSIAE